jgi:ribosomal protein S18 acetylase RimI-like enzyme
MTAIRRRDATDADVELLYRLRESSYREHVEILFGPWVEDQQRVFLANDMREARYEIVEVDGAAIGGVAVAAHDDHDFLEDIMIAPAHQRRGIGTALMREVMAAGARRAAAAVRPRRKSGAFALRAARLPRHGGRAAAHEDGMAVVTFRGTRSAAGDSRRVAP